MKKSFGIVFALCCLAGLLFACDKATQGLKPRLEIDPPDVNAQMTSAYKITITNTGDGPLVIESIPTMVPSMCPDGTTTAFTMQVDTTQAFPYTIAPAGAAVEEDNTKLVLNVAFADPTDLCGKTAKVTIISNDIDRPNLEINITKSEIEPAIEVAPNPLDMGFVPMGPNAASEDMGVTNAGLADLEIYKVEAIGFANGFAFMWDCNRSFSSANTEPWATDKTARIPVLFDTESGDHTIVDDSICAEPLVVPATTSYPMPVFYTAISDAPARVIFRFTTNDPDFDTNLGEAYEATVLANFGGPCLTVNPETIDFGSVVVATGEKGITVNACSCGDEPVEITSISLADGSSPDFSLDMADGGTVDEAHPQSIEPGACKTFLVKFIPSGVDKDIDGKLIPDQGTLLIANNSPREVSQTPITGTGVEAQCAVCQFDMLVGGVQIADNASIKPQEEILLKNHSTDPTPGGGIASYSWTVTQPPESTQVFDPSASSMDVTFQPNVVGTFQFCVEVFNVDGCSDKCCKTVEVKPPEGCHIELTWNTPADLDQSDECSYEQDCGSDMDLHVLHPLATGSVKDPQGQAYGYFDSVYDCYFFSVSPTWNGDHAADPLYQPSFDLDDTDGAGPENFTYSKPDPLYSTNAPACYRVGVHYYDDHNFGKSYPTVKVFIDSSSPVYERTLTSGMSMLDMWDVGRVCCSNKDPLKQFVENTKEDGSPVVVRNYPDETIH